MAVTHVFAGIPVKDRDASLGWYERLTGRAPDLVPNAREAAWRMNEMGWIYIVADPARAGSALHTLLVDDLDSRLVELEQREILTAGVEIVGPGVRQAIVTDPDGNRLKLGQPPER
jgi:catechol 2,3-dioxygenase-like lactoylglutathione lyase family enzyme